MVNQDLLFEIGTEELPAKSLRKLAAALSDNLCQQLHEAKIEFSGAFHYATPRRLAVVIRSLSTNQKPIVIERQGPSYATAFNKDGTPTLACIGFARSCGVTTTQLQLQETEKGQRLFCRIEQPGKSTISMLPELVREAVNKLPIQKPMRWGSGTTAFIRPVHWLVLLYGEQMVEMELFGKKTSRNSFGHRFHHPQAISIKNPLSYQKQLELEGKVLVDMEQRKQYIQQQIEEKSATFAGKSAVDDKLLEEVTALVEWPVVLAGQFKKEFLEVPAEALITSMKVHQKCFPILSYENKLHPFFVLVSNIASKDPQIVVEGNERVINARLSDAAFFYDNDLQRPLTDFTEKLEHVVFQESLGSLGDRCRRLATLSSTINRKLKLETEDAKRAAELCKFDLVSEMVGEFPELQGIMGYYYAVHAHEKTSVAEAIKEHYYPRFSGDQLPKSQLGITLALADRCDLLVGILGINKMPTGDKDPYALRRAAQGILRLLIEKTLPLDLYELLQITCDNYAIDLPNKQVVDQAYQFCMDRLRSWYLEQEVKSEMFAAVEAAMVTTPLDFDQRLKAVIQFSKLPESSALAAANKRVSNILKKSTDPTKKLTLSPALFEFEIERELSSLVEKKSLRVKTLYAKADYTEALSELATLKEPVDTFFDQVMVMVEDERVRNNRLALLKNLHELFTQVADISLLP